MQTKQQLRAETNKQISEFLSVGGIIQTVLTRRRRVQMRTTKHLGKSDSAGARATGRYNKA